MIFHHPLGNDTSKDNGEDDCSTSSGTVGHSWKKTFRKIWFRKKELASENFGPEKNWVSALCE